MRKQLFNAIKTALTASGTGINHVGLWNENMYYIEQEQAFGMPAVFVEFDNDDWQQVKDTTFRCRSQFSLHILTNYNQESDAIEALDLCERIQAIVNTIENTADFGNLQLAQSTFNHSHEDILELVETYQFTGMRSVGVWPPEPEPVDPPR